MSQGGTNEKKKCYIFKVMDKRAVTLCSFHWLEHMWILYIFHREYEHVYGKKEKDLKDIQPNVNSICLQVGISKRLTSESAGSLTYINVFTLLFAY